MRNSYCYDIDRALCMPENSIKVAPSPPGRPPASLRLKLTAKLALSWRYVIVAPKG